MYQVVRYSTRWKQRPGKADLMPVAVGKNVVGKFSTLEQAREYAAGKRQHVVEFTKKAIKEFRA